MKLYFICDCDPEDGSGGGIIRKGQIINLRKGGLEVVVVKPGKENYFDETTQTFTIQGLKKGSRLYYGMEALGLIQDKYINWANTVVRLLYKYINPGDIIFATSGGTLAPIIAGVKLKKKTKAKLIINYHDPTDFTTLHGVYSRNAKFPHVNRDRKERELIGFADFVITSSESYRRALIEKYPTLSKNSCCVYFGYIDPYEPTRIIGKYEKKTINIVYGGNFGPTQSPEILGLAARNLSGVKVTYVGNFQSNSAIVALGKESNIDLLPAKPLSEYLEYLDQNADLGFFSLRNNLTNYCVPSKLFDYINLGIPMIGVVKGDARAIIEENAYGCTSDDNVESLRNQLVRMSNHDNLIYYKSNVLKDRNNWAMSYRIQKVLDIIKNLTA